MAGCRLVGCSVISGQPLCSRAVAGVAVRLRQPGAHCPFWPPVTSLACGGRSLLAGAGSGSHCRVEFGQSRTIFGLGRVFGGEEEGDCGPGEARTILLLHVISAGPSKQPLMVRPSVDTGAGDRGGAPAESAVVAGTVSCREDVGLVVLR